MDFYTVAVRENEKRGVTEIYPDWQVERSRDLMIQGGSFYAIWDDAAGMWSTDEFDARRLIDEDLYRHADKIKGSTVVLSTKSSSTKMWESFKRFVKVCPDNAHALDDHLTFANTEVRKTDHVSRRLPYSLVEGSVAAWDEMMNVLYAPEERDKIEWAIGAIVAGDAKHIQKFLVLYGPAGTGKSTVLNIVELLFQGYTTTFEAKSLGSVNASFATEVFKNNPLVAIQHDGDLSRIEDNSRLNSVISHEFMTMNEKYKSSYTARVNAFLFMGTNQPVRISDAKSGIIRRLIDVHPTGERVSPDKYHTLTKQIEFELGSIAYHCLQRYKKMGKHYYNTYRPTEMMLQTDEFYNYVEAYFDIFKAQNGTSLKQAYQLYKEYCEESNIKRFLPQYKFREELRNYFHEFLTRYQEGDGVILRSYYKGFKGMSTATPAFVPDTTSVMIDLQPVDPEHPTSVFDRLYPDQPAQIAKPSGNPGLKWSNVKTTLSSLDPTSLHFVQVPEHHIVIDFDLVDEDGEKSITLNLAEASKWPSTYTEVSKSGQGLHLHYIYPGDPHTLASIYDVGIEIKTLLGDSALRRKLTMCNDLEVATLNAALPQKEAKLIDAKTIKSEKTLRDMVERNLRKEIHPGTKPSVDFIKKILDDAYDSDLSYDLTDLRGRVLTFAALSTHQADVCMKQVQLMQFMGKSNIPTSSDITEEPIVFFDIEVYPNLLVVCWKYAGSDTTVRMINPSAAEIEELLRLKLVGFNNRRYDNHILYACQLGYPQEAIYKLSQSIIENDHNALFGAAYNLSYADIYDFSSKKQSLKKFEIELGILHMELDFPWNEPIAEEHWPKVVEYCCNDVSATEAVFESRKQDFIARQILAELSGLSINHTTQNHTAKIIFGDDQNPQRSFVYTDLSEQFPGYIFDGKESTYRGEVTGEGGYVYAEPGIYENVALLDVASMHPTSIEALVAFGRYTERFSDLKRARMAIKHQEYENARTLLGGRLEPFLLDAESNPDGAAELAYALKIVINIVYGLTSARFPNPFKDNRNKDNIVAKRGALFMIDLKHAVQERGFTVAHIKTDSIKIPNATPEIIDFIMRFGEKYGYDFEHEATYDKFCLVNDAVYIARKDDKWTAVGAQFQHPYVFKTLFSHEDITFDDFCESKSVMQGTMYLNFNDAEDISGMVHVGRTGSFVPVQYDGGVLLRIKDGKSYAVTGTKGYRWITRDVAMMLQEESDLLLDMTYFEALVSNAVETITKFGSFEELVTKKGK